MRIDKALQINVKPENLHTMGLTPLHPHENKVQGSKFFALKRILNDVPDQNGFKWLYIPNEYGYCNFLGVQIKEFKNGMHQVKYKFAQSI